MHPYQECNWETRVLEKSSISLGDEIEITPLSGRRQRFELQRTIMDFVSTDFRGQCAVATKKLPAMKDDSFHLRLSQNNTTRFILESHRGPFWHNGSLVFSLLLTDGDEVEVGYNKIRFSKKSLAKQTLFPTLGTQQRLINSNIPILIEGETGTGKTTLARKIHDLSGRQGEFVHMNLSALSENLLESEIFGHCRGAFTGALNDKKGAIVRAQRGTLFLDEIDSISRSIQVKLLLFLDNYRVSPVGSSVSQKVDCRLIFASGSKLMNLASSGQMRPDFFHRISSGHKFELPPLRQNPQQILAFCEVFELKHKVTIEERLKEFYQGLEWQGNYRQLAGHLERKLVTTPGHKLFFNDQDEALLALDSYMPVRESEVLPLEEIKGKYCRKVYFQCQKNMNVTAKKLRISPRTLRTILRGKLGGDNIEDSD